MASVILKSNREGPLQYRHPWIFSGAIQKIEGAPGIGETVEIRSDDGSVLGYGAFSPHSQIAVRMWAFDPDEMVNEDFLRRRLARAIDMRRNLPDAVGNARRLVFSESDGLPGLIVDQYAEFLVCQFLSAGAEYWKDTIVALLNDLLSCKGIYERSDTDSREKEGLAKKTGVLYGMAPPDLEEITDGRLRFLVDIKSGHKTGWYLDQRGNHFFVAQYLRDKKALDCFCYTGGFSIAALSEGAELVTGIDASSASLCLARQNMELNKMDASRFIPEEGNVSQMLRKYRDAGRQFDAVILDPPKFILSRNQLDKGSRAYKDINMMAMKLLAPGGILATFSCSRAMGAELFQKTIAFAAADAKRDVQIISRINQAPDHPVAVNFPESEYLKGLICRVW
ncbi:MAG: class I SAM-dependent methyltransferase [Desulfobacterales bacterium]|jgi:23S rRNA (cytosine1962-C5)-methyltransferase|nr:class I SAM-dependent methyltransferase [Desulfobacterales bacterium]